MSPTTHLMTGAFLLLAQSALLLAGAVATYVRVYGPKPRALPAPARAAKPRYAAA